jgi:hypothetical protein
MTRQLFWHNNFRFKGRKVVFGLFKNKHFLKLGQNISIVFSKWKKSQRHTLRRSFSTLSIDNSF